jgi:hypothetical protein
MTTTSCVVKAASVRPPSQPGPIMPVGKRDTAGARGTPALSDPASGAAPDAGNSSQGMARGLDAGGR